MAAGIAKASGHLDKMVSHIGPPISYELPLDDQRLPISELIGKPIKLEWLGEIHCSNCGRKTKKSFQQGFCFPCAKKLARCDICIVRPEKCHYADGTCREPAWGEAHCMQPHIVYLANSSGLKVGITRLPQVPTRWIDQGASQALPILQVSSRYLSGLVEITLAAHVADKTNWQRMLKGKPEPLDLAEARDCLLAECQQDIDVLAERFGEGSVELLSGAGVVELEYPVQDYPTKVKAHNFDKAPVVEGVLQGIKGQYLMLDSGVLNVRKFSSYKVEVSLTD